MRFQPDQKEKSRKSILAAAGRKLRECGLHGVGVDALAAEAKVTSGAFYSNFKGKEDLFKGVIESTIGVDPSATDAGTPSEKLNRVKEYLKEYISMDHCKSVPEGCGLPALSADVARSSTAIKNIYRERIVGMIDHLAVGIASNEAKRRKQAWTVLSIMVGSISVARALPSGKERDELLSSALENATRLLDSP